MSRTVAFFTLGCKVNQYDSQAMLERFLEAGYEAREFGEAVNVNVVVTCVVTSVGEQKSRQMLHRAKRLNPGAELVAAGCLAQKDAEKLRGLGARLILGNRHRDEVVRLLEEAVREDIQLVAVEDIRSVPYEELHISNRQGRTRAVMKIQEGCDRFCSYCIIPHVRGGIRSRSPETIRMEAERLASGGFQEIVLTGIHLSSYGRDLDGADLIHAVRCVAESGIPRIRLGSLEPLAATEDFVNALTKIPQVCPQFHLSLQSGSDTVLRRMRRQYTSADYMLSAMRLKAAFPSCALTTDVLVGFPGETEDEFSQTLSFCRTVGFTKMHVFPFSSRAGTAAEKMAGQLSRAVKAERAARMSALDRELSEAFRSRMLATVQDVLFEQHAAKGEAEGYTPQYLLVKARGGVPGRIQPVRLDTLEGEGFRGTLIPST